VTTTIKVADTPARETPKQTSRASKVPSKLLKLNWTGGALMDLAVHSDGPDHWIVITSFKTQANYFVTNTFALPSHPTFENYKTVIDNEIGVLPQQRHRDRRSRGPCRNYLVHGGVRDHPRSATAGSVDEQHVPDGLRRFRCKR
jgi:hypothetical protein